MTLQQCRNVGLEIPADTEECSSLPNCNAGYIYIAGNFGQCSSTCGPGVQTRSVTCVTADVGTAVGESFCETAGVAKPAATQACESWGASCGGDTPAPRISTPAPVIAAPTATPVVTGGYTFEVLQWTQCSVS